MKDIDYLEERVRVRRIEKFFRQIKLFQGVYDYLPGGLPEDVELLTPEKLEEAQKSYKIRLANTKKELIEEIKVKNRQWWTYVVSFFLGGLFGFLYLRIVHDITYVPGEDFNEAIILFVVFGGLIGLLINWIIRARQIGILTQALGIIERQLIDLGWSELRDEKEKNFFTKLVEINFKYLDQYYLQTQEQADKSFRLASAASIAGLLIISAGIVMMFFSEVEPALVTTGAGVITELIASLFFYLYNRTILKMSQYHQKLVITQNISLALKISEDMKDEAKIKVQEMIVDRLTLDTNKYLSLKD